VATVAGMTTTTRVTVPFEITSWDQTGWYDADGVEAGRAEVRKTFAGDFTGSSVAQLVLVQLDGTGALYTAVEVLTGALEGRAGSFALQHGASAETGAEFSPGRIVTGSGRGELAGISGTAEFRHDEAGARMTLDYTFG
jgi:hypothetical protein